jgi:hypothetical protein
MIPLFEGCRDSARTALGNPAALHARTNGALMDEAKRSPTPSLLLLKQHQATLL